MIRKFVISAATLTLGLSVFAVGSANAGAAKVDVSNDTVVCNTVVATAKIKPGLVNGGTATSTLILVKGSLGGCTVSGANPAIIAPGSTFTGKLTGSSNDCSNLLGTTATTGTLTIKWKADPTTPLLQTSSVVNVTGITGGLYTSDPWGAGYGSFGIQSSGVTGAFTGGDGGASSATQAVTSQDAGALLGACSSVKGLATINLGLGQVSLG